MKTQKVIRPPPIRSQALPAADRTADPIELAIVDARRREVEALARESVKEN